MVNPEQLPLFKKGQEIFELVKNIADLISEEDQVLDSLKSMLLQDAMLLTIKVSGAEAGDLYDIRMENAVIIRKAAREILTHCTSLEMFGFSEVQYLFLIREAIEEYRQLFVEWVKNFDPWNYVTDPWGLFNPPGIDAEGPGPDEEF